MLIDTGPLVALVDHRQAGHARCRAAFDAAVYPLVSTWPCLTGAMYLCPRSGGHHYQQQVWQMRSDGLIRLHHSGDVEADRVDGLMRKHRDTPMDLADASLVAAAEALGDRDVFTLDGDFYVYRLADGGAFNVVPA